MLTMRLIGIVLLTYLATDANAATSNFDKDHENWSAVTQVREVVYQGTGGNPGGHVCASDTGSGTWYWTAPLKFFGDISSAYNKNLSFDLTQSNTSRQFDEDDVILVSAKGPVLVFDLPTNPGNNWTNYSINLNERAGWKILNSNTVPSQAQMQAVLSSLTGLLIRGDYSYDSEADTVCLDNVTLDSIPNQPLPSSEIVSHFFEVDEQNWSAVTQVDKVQHATVGGSPAGHICASDNSSDTWYWKAPLDFLGDIANAYGSGRSLTFSIKQSNIERQFNEDDVILVGGDGLALVYNMYFNPGPSWTAYRIPLDDTAGWKIQGSNVTPSQAQMQTVLSSLTDLLIRGDYNYYDNSEADTVCLDNVVLEVLPLSGVIAISNSFEVNGEGWAISVGAADGKHIINQEGNPRGHLCAADASSNTWYWIAPKLFRCYFHKGYNGALTFDIRQSNTSRQFDDADIILSGDNLTLVFDTYLNPGPSWTIYRVPLNENLGWKVAQSNRKPSQAEIQRVLSSLNYLAIRGDYSYDNSEADTVCLDNPSLVVDADNDNDSIPNAIEKREGLEPLTKDNDIFQEPRLFVMQQYRDFLGREGDESGISYWIDIINSRSQTPVQVIDNFFNSSEFQNIIAPVVRLYFAYFNRIPDYDGLQYWINIYQGNCLSLEEISQVFANSAEFLNAYGNLDNGSFVRLVYQNVLGRNPDDGGFSYWVKQLDDGFVTRGQMMLAFSESAENKNANSSKVYVVMLYVGMLHRSPEQDGFDFWVNAVNSGISGQVLINDFLNSSEYRGRFL